SPLPYQASFGLEVHMGRGGVRVNPDFGFGVSSELFGFEAGGFVGLSDATHVDMMGGLELEVETSISGLARTLGPYASVGRFYGLDPASAADPISYRGTYLEGGIGWSAVPLLEVSAQANYSFNPIGWALGRFRREGAANELR